MTRNLIYTPAARLLAVGCLLISCMAASANVFAARVSVTVVSPAGDLLEDAVVSLHSDLLAQPDVIAPAIMDQRARQFFPTVVPVQVGADVLFPNSDDVRHHVYSFSRPNDFEIQLYHSEASKPLRFEHPGIVVLGCNIHDGMIGYLRVLDTPLFGKSDADGKVTINDVPTGEYTLEAWHPDIGTRVFQTSMRIGAGGGKLKVKLQVEPQAAPKASNKESHSLQSLFRDY